MITHGIMILAAATVNGVAVPSNLTQTVRAFLEAFASSPSETEQMVTSDAMISIGDVGGTYSEFLWHVRTRSNWLATCRVKALQMTPLPDQAAMEANQWLKGGSLTLFEGTYACTGPSRKRTQVAVSVILKDGRVAQVSLNTSAQS